MNFNRPCGDGVKPSAIFNGAGYRNHRQRLSKRDDSRADLADGLTRAIAAVPDGMASRCRFAAANSRSPKGVGNKNQGSPDSRTGAILLVFGQDEATRDQDQRASRRHSRFLTAHAVPGKTKGRIYALRGRSDFFPATSPAQSTVKSALRKWCGFQAAISWDRTGTILRKLPRIL